jgi:hypothetical protein
VAEEYHQDYYKKNPLRYRFYRGGSGCDKFLEKLGPMPSLFVSIPRTLRK